MRQELEQDAVMHLRKLRYRTIQRLQKKAEEKQINIGALSLLHKIKCRPEMTQKSLAKELFLTSSALSQWLSKLEEKGYVERKENPLDRREKLLVLSELGEELLSDSKKDMEEIHAELFKSLSDLELEQFGKLLRKLSGDADD